MDVMLVKLALMVVMAGVNLLCILLPLKFSGPKLAEDVKSSVLFILANSLTAGVFLATCFIQAIPLVDEKFMEIFKLHSLSQSTALATSQCCILIGFVCIMVIEQAVAHYQHKHSSKDDTRDNFPIVEIPDGYLASSDESETDLLGEDESRKTMLPKKKRKNPKISGITVGLPSSNSAQSPRTKMKSPRVAKSFLPASSTTKSVSNINNSHQHNHTSGHCHSHMVDVLQQNHGLRCVLLIFALSAHTLFEGMAVGLQTEVQTLVNFFLGVLVHECFIAFAVGVNLAKQNIKRRILILLAVVFSLTVPFGMMVGMAIGQISGFSASLSSALLQAFASGTFLYVIFLEILPPEIYATQKRLLRFLIFVVGFGIILALRFGLKMEHDGMPQNTNC